MTDEELARYLHIDAALVAKIDSAQRATYEHMAEVEHALNLWQAGLGPKPGGVIVCRPHRRRG